MSSDSIGAGTVWFETVGQELRQAKFAILCVTPHNLKSTWLHFEAGAVGMAQLDEDPIPKAVVPYLFDLEPSQLVPPLSQYQAIPATFEGTSRLVVALNRVAAAPLDEVDLRRSFEKWWPDLASRFEAVSAAVLREGPVETPPKSEAFLLEEILNLVRHRREHDLRVIRSREDRLFDLEAALNLSFPNDGLLIELQQDQISVVVTANVRVTNGMIARIADLIDVNGFTVGKISQSFA